MPEDTTWFWSAIGTTGIILGEIVVKIRKWFKNVENKILWSVVGIWLIFFRFLRRRIDLPEDTIWIELTIFATGIILGGIVVKIRRWFKEETTDTHQES